MADVIDKITDLMLMIGINNLAFLMLLVSVLYFVPAPIDAVAAETGPAIGISVCTP